jgi:hypothetical protein
LVAAALVTAGLSEEGLIAVELATEEEFVAGEAVKGFCVQ